MRSFHECLEIVSGKPISVLIGRKTEYLSCLMREQGIIPFCIRNDILVRIQQKDRIKMKGSRLKKAEDLDSIDRCAFKRCMACHNIFSKKDKVTAPFSKGNGFHK